MCNFTKIVTITVILSEPIERENGQQELRVIVSDGRRSFEILLISNGQEVTAYYENDGACAVSCDPNLENLNVGDQIELGVAIPKDNKGQF